jgi:hypothetical protein
MRTEGGQDCCKCSISSLGPRRSIFIYLLNMQVLCINPISVSVCYNKMNRRLLDNRLCAANFGVSIYSRVTNMIDLFCPQMAMRIEFAARIMVKF